MKILNKIWNFRAILFIPILALVVYLDMFAGEVPHEVEDPIMRENFEDLGDRQGFQMTDYGQAVLTAGSTFVTLNRDYLDVDNYMVSVEPHLTDWPSHDSLRVFRAFKISSDSIKIVALLIQTSLGLDGNCADTVDWYTIAKVR